MELGLRKPNFTILFKIITLVLTFSAAQYSYAENKKNAAFMGVGSCSSSNCHGSVSPRNATNVLQNEYVTWEKHDAHSKAWVNLTNEDSKRIAYNLGIKSAENEPLCLKCHATYLPENGRKGSNYHIEDGVGCESCHGAAENYLGPHTANDSTHEQNIKNGMLDVLAADKRANLCASCHFGNEDKAVTHRLIGAGHPRLTFELDTFSMIQPKHWVVDEDYVKRKSDYDSVSAWLSGQVEIAKLSLERLASDKLSKDGVFPELTIFNCYACHHSLTEEQWKTREYNGRPGELQLNLSSLVILKEALAPLSPQLASDLSVQLAALHANYKNGQKDALAKTRKLLPEASALLKKASFSEGLNRQILSRLARFASETGNLQYELAEQIAMGMSSILASLSPDGRLHKPELDAIYSSLKDARSFKPEDFNRAAKRLLSSLQ